MNSSTHAERHEEEKLPVAYLDTPVSRSQSLPVPAFLF